MNIYVASSWRNAIQPSVVHALRAAGHEVYDFKNPAPGEHGFSWSEIDPEWKRWSPEKFRVALTHPVAQHGFSLDMDALKRCDACVLVMPCGRSAHLELGWATGAKKLTVVYFPLLTEPESDASFPEPELMYAMCDHVCISLDEVLAGCPLERWKIIRGNHG